MASFVLALLLVPHAPPKAPVSTLSGKNVLVVANSLTPEGIKLAKYYMAKRGVPTQNLVLITTDPAEFTKRVAFESEILPPIQQALRASKNPIDVLLFTKGVPIKVHKEALSVDGLVAMNGVATQPLAVPGFDYRFAVNPYYGKEEGFSHSKYGFYLHSRLDGYTYEDATKLVDRSLAAKANKGPFLFDAAPEHKGGDFGALNDSLANAGRNLSAQGFSTRHDEGTEFLSSNQPLAGYASWGSNDKSFSAESYHGLKFLPGAIAETYVSTSGRTFLPATGTNPQSLIADLISQGVTGVKGYVSEPYAFALARADILFGRYVKGYTMVESMFMASPVMRWKDVVIGDPLCAPYGG